MIGPSTTDQSIESLCWDEEESWWRFMTTGSRQQQGWNIVFSQPARFGEQDLESRRREWPTTYMLVDLSIPN